MVMRIDPFARPREFKLLGKVPHPAKAVLADVTGDGVEDVLVANLGSFNPGDHSAGSVELFDGTRGDPQQRLTLIRDVGRVSDIRLADLDGDADVDLLVGVFGWHQTGEVLWLENHGGLPRQWSETPQMIAEKTGVIGVPTFDHDGDGDVDFLALFSQEHEQTVLFANTGDGFVASPVDSAEHPAWGSNWIELVDLDQDGDEDVLLTNGDTLDDMFPKPYHGVRWLENDRGEYRPHDIGRMYAAHSSKAGDLDGDGDLDVVVSAFIPQANTRDQRYSMTYDIPSLVWFEHIRPGEFRRHVIKRNDCFHASLDLGDVEGDGDLDIVVGNFTMTIGGWDEISEWLEIWENQTIR